jgi:hypothetical protein
MPNGANDNRGRGREAEETAIRRLMERLTQVFPEVPEAEIARAVQGRYHDFDDSPVRDFVPVLVERSVRQHLVTATPRHRA